MNDEENPYQIDDEDTMNCLCEICPLFDECDGWMFTPYCMTDRLNNFS